MKLRRYCENTWSVLLLDDDEPCPGEYVVYDGATMLDGWAGSRFDTHLIPCGRRDHVPLDDQTLCGVGLAAGEVCVKQLDHEGVHASDLDMAHIMLDDDSEK